MNPLYNASTQNPGFQANRAKTYTLADVIRLVKDSGKTPEQFARDMLSQEEIERYSQMANSAINQIRK